MTIAFLYNVRHIYPNENDPRSFLEADFDEKESIDFMINHFKGIGFDVIPIEANQDAYLRLFENKSKIELAFNYSEGIYGEDREAQIPAMLEMLKIPYTGSTPLTQALGLNKAKTKEVLQANNVPTLPFQVFENSSEELSKVLNFPLIVKPIAEGSSAGITNESIIENVNLLSQRIEFVIKTFGQPALVEPYLEGREFSVALLGNPPEILPIIEPNHSLLPKDFKPIDSIEVKWDFEDKVKDYLVCPAQINKDLKRKLDKIALDTWKALGVRDLCRIDIRCDEDENPYVLEINSPPGLIPPEISETSYFPLAAKAMGLSYQALLKRITDTSLERYKNHPQLD